MQALLQESYFSLFLIITLGLLLGKISFRGISLQSSAIMFVAMFFGHYGIQLPEELQQIGLILFIFTVGIQAGPGFFDAFRTGEAFKMSIPVFILIGLTAFLVFSLNYILKIDSNIMTGLFAGSLSCTPALAAAIETTKSSIVSIGYTITYPFSMMATVIFMRLMPRFLKTDLKEVEEKSEIQAEEKNPKLQSKNFIVSNKNIFNKSISELQIYTMTQSNISRMKQGDEIFLPTPNTVLNSGDIIHAIGTENSLKKVQLLIGCETKEILKLKQETQVKRIIASNKNIIGKKLGTISELSRHSAISTRIRRSGIDISPCENTTIRFGDKLTIIAPREKMNLITSLIGGSSDGGIDFLPIAISIVLGILVGQIEIPLGQMSISPGYTGGILAMTLLLGRLDKTGPLLWSVAGNVNQFLRQLGLLFFLAAVGTQSGSEIVSGISEYGFSIFFLGAFLTLVPMILTTYISHKFLKVDLLSLFGIIAAATTSAPALSAVNDMTKSNVPNRTYSIVYPIALILSILLSQALGLLL